VIGSSLAVVSSKTQRFSTKFEDLFSSLILFYIVNYLDFLKSFYLMYEKLKKIIQRCLSNLFLRNLYVCGGSTETLTYVDATEVLKDSSGCEISIITIFILKFDLFSLDNFRLRIIYLTEFIYFQRAGSGATLAVNFGNVVWSLP